MNEEFAKALRQAVLAVVWDICVITDDEFGTHGISWAAMPCVARIRELYPDATLDEAAIASNAVDAWARHKETRSADVIAL